MIWTSRERSESRVTPRFLAVDLMLGRRGPRLVSSFTLWDGGPKMITSVLDSLS